MQKTTKDDRDTFIHFLMGVHGLTKQGEDAETQKCIDEAVVWFDEFITTLRKETEEAYQQGKEDAYGEAAKVVNELV